MECYEGATMIKTFRGLIADNAQDTIVLHTNDGSTGYRIVKLQIIPNTPYDQNAAEHVLKIYKVNQNPPSGSLIDGVVDFSDNTLLGVAIINNNTTGYQYPSIPTIIFDTEVFNQDIFITHIDMVNAVACNYYLELEQVKLDMMENTVATLKDIRNTVAGIP